MKIIAFTVADKAHEQMAFNLKKSFNKFHPNVEFKIYGDKEVRKFLKQDPDFFYKQKPWIMRQLIEDYDLVIGFDADSIVTDSLEMILEGEYEVGVVANFNQTDTKIYGAVSVWNIHPQVYVNCGLVATTSKEFVQHWWELCSRVQLFRSYQYREQDLLNILVHYGNYRWINFDFDGGAFFGLSGKDLWNEAVVKDGQLVVEFADDKGKVVLTRPIRVIHVGGGNAKNKMDLGVFFQDEALKYIKSLYE